MTLQFLQAQVRKYAVTVCTVLMLLFCCETRAANTEDNPGGGSTITVGEIKLAGNKITKPEIIYRELLFKSGDVLPPALWQQSLAQSRQNLLNTALFNFVDVDTISRDADKSVIDVTFHFIERWYLWPLPILELADRNFNEWWETRDFSRLNYGFYLNHLNFRGRREILQALFISGYSQSFSLSYLKPNVNPSQTIGLGFSASYTRRRELAYDTREDQLVYFDDARSFAMQRFALSTMFYFRPQIYQSHSIWLNFNQFLFNDTIKRLNPDFFVNHNTAPQYLSLIYEFRSDHRNLKYYPTSGYYYDLVLSKHGLGIFRKTGIDVFNVSTTYKKYLELSPRWFLMAGTTAKVSITTPQPYFLNHSLGYMYDFIRGYEYYVVNGLHTGLIKTNLKYQILPQKIIYLPFIRTEKFRKMHLSLFLGLHADVGYVYEPNHNSNFDNRLPNRLLWGNGIGLDLVTYYDRVVRLEYSINHFGEHGVFIHFLAPI